MCWRRLRSFTRQRGLPSSRGSTWTALFSQGRTFDHPQLSLNKTVFRSRIDKSVKTQFLPGLLQQSAVLSWLVLHLLAVLWAVLKKKKDLGHLLSLKDMKVKFAVSLASSNTWIFAYTLIVVSLLVLAGGSEAEKQEEMSSKQIIQGFVNPSLRHVGTYLCASRYHRWVYKVKFKQIES